MPRINCFGERKLLRADPREASGGTNLEDFAAAGERKQKERQTIDVGVPIPR